MVYVVQRVVDGAVLSVPDLATETTLDPAVGSYDPPLTKQRIHCVVLRSEIRGAVFPVGDLVSDMGALGFEYVDADSSVGRAEPAYIRFLPLTAENFVVFKACMVGWDRLAAQLPTTSDLRYYFREQMVL